jgi:hypothetical protein
MHARREIEWRRAVFDRQMIDDHDVINEILSTIPLGLTK